MPRRALENYDAVVGAAVVHDVDREFEAWLANEPAAVTRSADLWRVLRERAPVHRHRDMIVVSSYELARTIMRDHDTFSSDVSTKGDRARRSERSATSTRALRSLDEVVAFESMLMNRRDGAAHAALRAPFAASVVRRRVEDFREVIDAEVEGVVARLARDGRLEPVVLAQEVTGRVVCRLVGAPVADRQRLRAWVKAVADNRHNVEPGAISPAHQAWRELADYVAALVEGLCASRKLGPLSEALITTFGEAADGPVRAAAHLMSLLGGQDSTATVIACGIDELLVAGDQWRRLAAEPALAANAVEEAVRFVSPSQVMMRRATAATRLDGLVVRPDETVVVVVAAANRDPNVFDDPERLDVERPNANRHLGFGFGRHHCLGVWLARAQIAATFRHLPVRHPAVLN